MTAPSSGIWKAAVKYTQTLVPFYLKQSGKAVSSKKKKKTPGLSAESARWSGDIYIVLSLEKLFLQTYGLELSVGFFFFFENIVAKFCGQ